MERTGTQADGKVFFLGNQSQRDTFQRAGLQLPCYSSDHALSLHIVNTQATYGIAKRDISREG